MDVKIKQRMFVDEKEYFVNEKGRKYTRLGFDSIRSVACSSFLYRLGKKLNIVSKAFVEMHKSKQDYIDPAIYDYCIEFPTFYVLAQKNNLAGVQIVEQFDRSTIFPCGKLLFFNKDRYAIVADESKTVAIYATNEGTEYANLPISVGSLEGVELNGKNFQIFANKFNLTGDLISAAAQVKNENELDALTKFFNLLLIEDVNNYNELTKKFVLTDKDGNFILDPENLDVQDFRITLKEMAFDSRMDAITNKNNVLAFYSIKMKFLMQKNTNKQFKGNLQHLITQIK